MACYSPLKGWAKQGGGFTMSGQEAFNDMKMEVACGQCVGCKLEKARIWSCRIMNEARLHPVNAFVTLTYDDDIKLEKEPDWDYGLQITDLQKFFKRLRKWKEPEKIRFYACGEYGDQTFRPHYHAIIFNYWPDDCKLYKQTSYGNLYSSKKLEKIWGYGFCSVGEVTFETASYTARYVTKKITAGNDYSSYEKDLEARFKYRGRDPEFGVMSRRPGIGLEYWHKYKNDIISSDSIVVRGREVRPPRYYYDKLKESDPDVHESIRFDRWLKFERESEDRMSQVEEAKLKKQNFYKRSTI